MLADMSSTVSKGYPTELATGLCLGWEDLEIMYPRTKYHYHLNLDPVRIQAGQYRVLIREDPKIRIVLTQYR